MDMNDLEAELAWEAPLRRHQTQKQRVGLEPSLLHLSVLGKEHDDDLYEAYGEDQWFD